MSTGTIYHHLDTLSSLIEQQDDKKYYLTELGLHAYTSLIDNKDTIITPEFSKKEFKSPILKGLMFLTPKTYLNYENKRTYSVMIFSILIALIGSIFCGLNGLFPFFLFFAESLMIFTTAEAIIQFLLAFLFIGNILLYFLINEGLSRVIYRKRENTLKFLASFAIIFFPLDIYLVLRFILSSTGALDFSYIRVLDNVLMILFQVWSLWLLTYNLSINKKLKIENSLIVSLLIHYGGFSIILLISI
ncbi:MAG TPA: hypothetical protein VMV43_10175 [Candidatus Nanopelagicaceae bacterium]|nr:hypothetical protein [Candidatus Nanopelagicaceae bacterium]